AADDGASLLVVVGGDGSVNEVANGIAGRDGVEVAVLPRGTGWDFVRTYGIPHRLAGAIEVALTGRPRAIDLGRVRYRTWARSDDGRLDVLLIGDLTKRDLLVTLPKAYRGKHLPHPKAELLRGAAVTVEGEQPLPIQLDGEQPGTTPARFEIVPGALRLRAPA